ncbi:MAG: ComF family protein [Leptolyngbyaceae cyanobacterium bins.302]|nr:ComF family protein [Leptolyngbyaceae cyanobacterium bins.302]
MLNRLQSWGRFFTQSLSLVTKDSCPLCQRSTAQTFCSDCQHQLQRCQREPKWQRDQKLPIFAWGSYGGALKRSIAALKYHNHPELAVSMGSWMANAWMQQPEHQRAIVVPIPMHDRKQRERGFNQAELLAKSFCALTGLRLEANGLRRIRDTEAQFRLSSGDRSQNLKDAFCLGSPFSKRLPTHPVLLLDDIYTTGATARAAAQVLRSHGIRVQGIVVLARSERSNFSQ